MKHCVETWFSCDCHAYGEYRSNHSIFVWKLNFVAVAALHIYLKLQIQIVNF